MTCLKVFIHQVNIVFPSIVYPSSPITFLGLDVSSDSSSLLDELNKVKGWLLPEAHCYNVSHFFAIPSTASLCDAPKIACQILAVGVPLCLYKSP